MPAPPTAPTVQRRRPIAVHLGLVLLVGATLVALAGGGQATAGIAAPAQEGDEAETTGDEIADDILLLGAEAYAANCSSCHQAGGVGVPGQFPPLLGNPNVEDSEYLVEVITMGREGEITVLGETYNSRMPAFSTIPDDEVTALVVYIQSGFQTPAVVPAPAGSSGTATGLPGLASFTWVAAMLIAGGLALLVLWPRMTSAHDGLEMPWLDASLKSALIVIGFILFLVFVPNWVLNTDAVQNLDRMAQDIIGSGLWAGALAVGLWALWYAHREDRL